MPNSQVPRATLPGSLGRGTVPLLRLGVVRPARPFAGHGVPAQLPGLDDPPLRLVDVALVLDGPHADAHALFGEVDVAARHALLGGAADLDDALVDVVADDGEAAEDDGEEDEGDELPGGVVSRGAASRRASWAPICDLVSTGEGLAMKSARKRGFGGDDNMTRIIRRGSQPG